MTIDDLFRAWADQMIELTHPPAVAALQLPWASLEASFTPCLLQFNIPHSSEAEFCSPSYVPSKSTEFTV